LERIDVQYPSTERGDMLIFMSGINEILTLADELKRYLLSKGDGEIGRGGRIKRKSNYGV
jgi:hypothetical protein